MVPHLFVGHSCANCCHNCNYSHKTQFNPDINECAFENGGCNHTCINTAGSYHCQCQDGFVLAEDERACSGIILHKRFLKECECQMCLNVDIDECSEGLHSCEQTCVNSPGSFSCSCLEGYILSDSEECCAGNNIAYNVFCDIYIRTQFCTKGVPV